MARVNEDVLNSYEQLSLSSLDKDKTLVVVVDMVKGFCEFGAMSDQAISDIVPDIQKVLNYYPKHLYFMDNHDKDCLEFTLYPPHCIQGEDEALIVDALFNDFNQSEVVYKNSTNGFMAPEFLKKLETIKKDYENVIVTGCCTDICVLQFALSFMGYLVQSNIKMNVICPINCVDTYDAPGVHEAKEFNEFAFKLLKNAGINVVKGMN